MNYILKPKVKKNYIETTRKKQENSPPPPGFWMTRNQSRELGQRGWVPQINEVKIKRIQPGYDGFVCFLISRPTEHLQSLKESKSEIQKRDDEKL